MAKTFKTKQEREEKLGGRLVIDWAKNGAVTYVLGAMRVELPIYATKVESNSRSLIYVEMVATLPRANVETT